MSRTTPQIPTRFASVCTRSFIVNIEPIAPHETYDCPSVSRGKGIGANCEPVRHVFVAHGGLCGDGGTEQPKQRKLVEGRHQMWASNRNIQSGHQSQCLSCRLGRHRKKFQHIVPCVWKKKKFLVHSKGIPAGLPVPPPKQEAINGG